MLKNVASTVLSGVMRFVSTRPICSFPRVGINGFGRIGKCIMRQCFENNVNIVAVNQPFVDMNSIAYTFKYDTVHREFKGKIEVCNKQLQINGHGVKVSHEGDAEKIKWNDLCVDYVIDATGKYTEVDNAMKHVKAGAKKVIISAPSKDAPMFVGGVNFDTYDKSMQVVSNSSCTTNCAAPVIKVIHEAFVVQSCMMTTTHAMTASQPVHDGMMNRSGPYNIVPGTTGAAKAVVKVLPHLDGKIKADAARVPVLDVSLLKLYINIGKEATADTIKNEIKCRADSDLKDVLSYTDQKNVSSDFIGNTFSAIVDLNQIEVIGNMITIGAWYDNEMGYSCRLLDLVKHMAVVDGGCR